MSKGYICFTVIQVWVGRKIADIVVENERDIAVFSSRDSAETMEEAVSDLRLQ
jgi:hypothetical protein